MTLEYALAFAIAMGFWTALPGPGLAVVVSRTLAAGPRAGWAVITGLVLADLIFLAIAFVGLMAIANTMGPVFEAVKYAGAAYLVWRGWRMIAGAEADVAAPAGGGGARWQDVTIGLVTTLGNPKAIVFFGALLPAFVDMTAVAAGDFLILAAIVAGVSYALYGACIVLAERTRHMMASTTAAARLRKVTGTVLIGSGVVIATR